MNGVPYAVAGVMPEGFLYPLNTEIWVPLQLDPFATPRAQSPSYQVLGRIRSGVSVDEANADLNTIASRIAADNTSTNEGVQALVEPFIQAFVGNGMRMLYAMFGAAIFVLLIACANVANLLLARAAHRSKEISVRVSLGASRAAVVRQFLAEAMLLSLGGAILGTGIAYAGIEAFRRAVTANVQPPFFVEFRLDSFVLVFIVAVAFLASLVSGALPAIQSSRADINEILKDESRGASSLHIGKMSRAVVIFELALSCGLLVGAGLMAKSVTKLRNIAPGFVSENMFTARVGFPTGSTTDSAHQRLFWEQLPERLAQIPGARSASVSSGLPAATMAPQVIIPEGRTYPREQDRPRARTLSVTPDFFRTFTIPLRQGRFFTSDDRVGAPLVAIVTQQFAEIHFRGADPIGRRFRIPIGPDSAAWRTIVGVVPKVFSGDNQAPWDPAFFLPFAQTPSNLASIAVKTAGAPMAVTPEVRDAIRSLNADLPIYNVFSMHDALARATFMTRVFGTMLMFFGVAALFLAAVGLYAVMAFSVSQRTREIGIRMALGADAGAVIRMMLAQGMRQLAIGLTLGLGLAAVLSNGISRLTFDVEPRDPVIFGGVVAVLAAGLCLLPSARRAARVDPRRAGRAEYRT